MVLGQSGPVTWGPGYDANAVDLPGNTYDDFYTPTTHVTLQTYADDICKILDQLDEPVVLVVHSLGGLTITQIAGDRPHRFEPWSTCPRFYWPPSKP